jgi:hypothetical protein
MATTATPPPIHRRWLWWPCRYIAAVATRWPCGGPIGGHCLTVADIESIVRTAVAQSRISRFTTRFSLKGKGSWRLASTTLQPSAKSGLMTEPAITSAAARARRYRARKREGIRCLRVRLRQVVITNLIADGFLPPDWRSDRDVEHALYALYNAARAARITARRA